MLSWLIYAAIGKVLIYLWSKFPLPEKLEKIKQIEQLHSCHLCSGVWIYTVLAWLLGVDLLELWFGFSHVIALSEIVTGCVTSYVIHLVI